MNLHKHSSTSGPARLLAATLTLGTLVGGLAACDKKDGGTDGSKESIDKGIEKFDFKNATVVDQQGEKQKFKDGHVTVEGYEDMEDDEGNKVGWNIAEGPKFTDIDGDNDLDAAIIYEWVPASGTSVFTAFVWTWDSGKAVQLKHPIQGGNYGAVRDLKANKDGFEVTTVSRPYGAPGSEQDGKEETFTVGVKDGHPVQTKPTFGSVDRCVEHDTDAPQARGDGTPPRIAPEEDATPIGEKDDFEIIVTVASELNTDDWQLAKAERTDGSISCGWLKTDEAGQG